MTDHGFSIISVIILASVLSVGYAGWYIWQHGVAAIRSRWIIIALVPATFLAGLIAILMAVMYREFNGWPSSIGTNGFSPSLELLANWSTWLFACHLIAAMFIAPIVGLICHLIKRWRFAAFLVSIFSAGQIVLWALLAILPEGFQYWWWD